MYFANNTISPALFNRTFSFARGGATTSPDRVYPTYPNISTGSQVDSWEGWFVNATTEGKKARPVWDGRKTLFGASCCFCLERILESLKLDSVLTR